MKKTILTLAITMVMAGASLTSIAQQNKKAAKARKEVADAKKDLREAKIDSAADYQRFNTEAQVQIMDNDKKIAELRAQKASDNKEIKEKYDKQVLALEQKNNNLKTKIKGSSTTKTDRWTAFKREFTHDINEFGKAFKDIGVNNSN
jgi:PhoPQ-activated pathogenicity-related protein